MFYDLRTLSLLTLVFAIAVLGAAFGFQHIGGLDPCILCVYQRWPWVAVIALAALACALGGHRAPLALAGLALLVGAGFAGFHVGVEQQWWAGTAECGAAAGAPQTVEALKQQLLSTPVARCDEVAWSLFGISMAGYNLILSLAGAVVLAWSLTRSQRRSQP